MTTEPYYNKSSNPGAYHNAESNPYDNPYIPIAVYDNNEDEYMDCPCGFLPPLAVQWKQDMTRKVQYIIDHEGATSDDFRWRAPEEFIKTGRWPADVPRPLYYSVAQMNEWERNDD